MIKDLTDRILTIAKQNDLTCLFNVSGGSVALSIYEDLPPQQRVLYNLGYMRRKIGLVKFRIGALEEIAEIEILDGGELGQRVHKLALELEEHV